MDITYLIYAAIAVVVLVFVLKYLGVWGKVKGTAEEKANQLADAASTGLEKKRMKVRALGKALDNLADSMTTLDGKFGAAQGDVTRAQTALDKAVTELHNVQAVIADQNNMSADETQTLNTKAASVAAAEASLNAKKGAVAELAKQAQQIHEDYAARKAEFDEAAAEIPAAEAKQILINANSVAAEFGKKQEEFKRAAQLGADADRQLDEALAKSKSEAQEHGGKTDTERAAEKKAASSKAADILSRYGKPGATTTPAPNKDPETK